MAYLDDWGLDDLWEKIASSFARLTSAVGDVVLTGTSLAISNAAGAVMHYVNLGDVFAQRTAAARYIGISGNSITLQNDQGTQIDSQDISATYAKRSVAAHSMSLGAGGVLSLYDQDANLLDSEDLSNQLVTDTYLLEHMIFDVGITGSTASGSEVTITFYNGYGTELKHVTLYF